MTWSKSNQDPKVERRESELTSSLSMNRLSPVIQNADFDLPPLGLRSVQRDRLSMKLEARVISQCSTF